MSPTYQDVLFKARVEQFCQQNGFQKTNLAKMIFARNERVYTTIISADENSLINNSIFSPNQLAQFTVIYEKELNDLQNKVLILSSWSGVEPKRMEERVFGSQIIMDKLEKTEIESLTFQQENYDSLKKQAAMEVLDQSPRDIQAMIR